MAQKGSGAWKVAWLVVEADGKRTIPAFEYLRALDSSPRVRLLQILEAVRISGGPHRWRDTQSHDKMEGELDDLHEARDRHDQTLYRLYLKWISETSTVWVLDGRIKPNGTKIPDGEYEKIRELANLVAADPPPIATVDDMARLLLS